MIYKHCAIVIAMSEDSKKEFLEEIENFGTEAFKTLMDAWGGWESTLGKATQHIKYLADSLEKKARQICDPKIPLALELVKHDIRSCAQTIDAIAHTTKKHKNTDRLVAKIRTLMAVCHTVSYLATKGNRTHTLQFVSHDLELMLDAQKQAVRTPDAPKYFFSPELVATLQVYNNCKKRPGISICLGLYNDLCYTQIDDSGTGLIDVHGKALPKENVREIFRGKTTKNDVQRHGKGLQIAAQLAKLRGGFIEVISKTHNEPAIHYDTKTDTAHDTSERTTTGCTFRVYFTEKIA